MRLLLPQELYQAILERATKEKRSMKAVIVSILMDSFGLTSDPYKLKDIA